MPLFSHDLAKQLLELPDVPFTVHIKDEMFTKTLKDIRPIYNPVEICNNSVSPTEGMGAHSIELILSE